MNAEELCLDTSSWLYKHMRNTKWNKRGYKYEASVKKVLEETLKDQSTIEYEQCLEMVRNDIAIVKVEIATAYYSELVRQTSSDIGITFLKP